MKHSISETNSPFLPFKELQTSGIHSNANASTQAAIQAAQTVAGGGSGGGGGNGERRGNSPSPVLRVVVENMLYPITLDTIILIFKKYGTLAKIVTFTKNNTYQVGRCCAGLALSPFTHSSLHSLVKVRTSSPSFLPLFPLYRRWSSMRTVVSPRRPRWL